MPFAGEFPGIFLRDGVLKCPWRCLGCPTPFFSHGSYPGPLCRVIFLCLAASRTTGSGKDHRRRRSSLIDNHLLLLLHDREGTVTVVRLQLTFPPCAGTAGKAFSPGGYLMSIWGWD